MPREDRLKSRHWIIVDLFNQAAEQGLQSPNWEPLSELVLKVSGQRLPPGSLKYWYNGHSTPKLCEVEALAQALGYELELMRIEKS